MVSGQWSVIDKINLTITDPRPPTTNSKRILWKKDKKDKKDHREIVSLAELMKDRMTESEAN